MRRWVAGLVAVSVATVACGGDDDGKGASPTTTEPPSALVHDGFDEAGLTVERIEPTLDGELIELLGSSFDLHAVGDVLVAAFSVPDQEANVVARSTDQGKTWTTVELPGAEDTDLIDGEPELGRLGDAVVAYAGAESSGGNEIPLWTTVDGDTWQGGLVALSPDVSPHPDGGGELPDGRLIIPVVGEDGNFRMLTSEDDGASWGEDACRPPARQEDRSGGCEGPVRVGRGLWLHAQRISLDDGRTWEGPITVRPARCGDDPGQNVGDDAGPELSDVVVLADSQWLGSVTDPTRCEVSDEAVSNLALSRDGRLWEAVLPDPCAAAGGSSTVEGFSPPVPLGDGWLVQLRCIMGGNRDRTELYLLDRTGASPRKVATMDAAEASPTSLLHPPVASGDIVVVPEVDQRRTHRLIILHLRPAAD
jgi:hypothetical protein